MAESDVPTLSEFLERAWRELVDGVGDAGHGFHQPIVATVSGTGQPRARMVVLRQVDVAGRRLRFHTDVRASKVNELQQGVAWTFYDRPRRLQVRAFGPSQLASESRIEERWTDSLPASRKCYLVDPGPGSPLDEWGSGHQEWAGTRIPPVERTEEGRCNFTVVETEIVEFEVLRVRRQGHRRARYLWADGRWNGTWVVP